MMAKKKGLQQQNPKFRSNEKYFNCGKKGHYVRDCPDCIKPKRKLEDKKTEQKAKRAR